MPTKKAKREHDPSVEDMRVCRIASLTLVNAMVFHQVLANNDSRVTPLKAVLAGPYPAEELTRAWTFIINNIDYVPIFALAAEIVETLSGSIGIELSLRELGKSAIRITGQRAALRHDLMGRIYHLLLKDAKYFGAFYTTVPAASLLLKLALDPHEIDCDWTDPDEIGKLRIADLACGTGTLLKASLQTIMDNHIRASAGALMKPALSAVHQRLLEDCLWGLDVVPFAIHLAASALAIHEPDVKFDKMRLFTLPLGVIRNVVKLGSLDLVSYDRLPVQADLLGGPASGAERITGSGSKTEVVDVPPLDLCVMNPPFTRSVGGNLLFGNLPPKVRSKMQSTLKRSVGNQIPPFRANITAGLGSVLAAIGFKRVKEGGQLALVLPRALLAGVAWKETRSLLGENCHIRYIIVSHERGSWNFSENTKLSECLVVARKLTKKEDDRDRPTKIVNLWEKPKSSIDALMVAERIRNTDGVPLEGSVASAPLEGGRLGEVVLCPRSSIKAGIWAEEVAFAQTDLSRVAHHVSRGRLYLPGSGCVADIPVVRLGELMILGPDRRDIHDGFGLASSPTSYPAFWGHETAAVDCLSQTPNSYLHPLAKAGKGRHLRDATLLWSRRGRLLIAERLRLTTARVVSIRCKEEVLSNTWWPAAPAESGISAELLEKALCMWLNSSLGLITLIAARVDTEGSWVEIKKPILQEMKVVDFRRIPSDRLQTLAGAFDALQSLSLSSIVQIAVDQVRSRIDQVILESLGITCDLKAIREMLARDPLV